MSLESPTILKCLAEVKRILFEEILVTNKVVTKIKFHLPCSHFKDHVDFLPYWEAGTCTCIHLQCILSMRFLGLIAPSHCCRAGLVIFLHL